ncbi:Chloride channel protein EriC [Hoeflea phototrophica DFL-43]|uniref:Chloride channel protein EriC n=1 Tax=Hoeflea phototrophica (strain DSM 17068 / NCIMB 14078 / DFL-43) TaxID=411684 RepID=A9D3G4_HOEPD|nr:chloride channel protein [Hoeflea phototrophica]EDQ33671.1 Chloride channel protein EriC [Hoeflea phototrophica DFL-43]
MLDILRATPARIKQWVTPNIRAYLENRQPMIWALSLLIGLSVALAAIAFRWLIGVVQLYWLGDSSEQVFSAARNTPWYMILAGPLIGGVVVGVIIWKFLPSRRTGGVADVIEARALAGRRLSLREGIISAFATAFSLGAGASAGREGPVIHLGATLASAMGQRLSLPDWSRRTLLAAGVASAISASFNAPIAGVLFAHEVILGHYAMRAFVPIVISSAAGAILSRAWFGDAAAFIVPEYQITSYFEFPAFALLGVVCALVAVAFQFALFAADYVARRSPVPVWALPIIGGVMVGLMGIAFPHILGVGYETTDLALWGQLPLVLMLTLIVMKTLATAITLAARFGGGIFSPSLYLGAMTGGAFGLIAAGVFPDLASSEALYSILGMGAVAGAVLGAPISTTVIVFELTGGYALSIALLLTVAIAHGITQALHGHSYFQWQLEMRGLFVQDGPHRTVLRNVRVMDFMTLPEDGAETAYFDPEAGTTALKLTDTLETALRAFDAGGHTRLPVVAEGSDEDGRIIGWAEQVKAVSHFNRRLIAASEEEHR